MDVSQQHLFETIRHGHAICLDRIDPNRSIANGFWSRDQMAVVLARVRALEAGLDLAKAGLRTVAENERSQGSYGDHCRAVLAALAGEG